MSNTLLNQPAPEFSAENQHGETVTLSQYRGKNVALVFFPLAFSGICQDELCELRDNFEELSKGTVELIAISVDSKFALRAWAESQGYQFNLLSDRWPTGAIAREYGVFLSDRGIATRATFLIDAEGIIRAEIINSPSEARSLDKYREALTQLVT